MIRLVVQNQQNGDFVELDTFGNENINLTLQVDDVRDIENKQASFSKDFNLPATKNNNKFFEHYYNVDRYTTNFNAYKNVKAFLYSDDVLVLEGFLKLLNVVDKNTEVTYNVVMFNDVANIIETLADATINDLDLTDINHKITPLNVIQSWFGLTTLTAGGTTDKVYYALVNDGQIYVDDTNLYMPNYQSNYFLNINLKYIVDKIFALAGFTFNSTFLSSTLFNNIFFDIGYIDGNATDYPKSIIEADTGSGTDSVGGNAGTDIGNVFNPTSINFANESGDLDNDFNQTTSVLTAPFDCYVNIEYRIMATNSSDAQFGNLHCFAQDVSLGQVSIPDTTLNSGSPYDVIHTFTGSVYLIQGETLNIRFAAMTGDVMIYNTNGFPPRLKLELLDASTSTLVKSRRGSIKLADILRDVFTAFNLTVESEQNNILKIETYNDYITNNVVDWSNKVNSNEFVIEPIEIPKRLEFKHAEDSADYYHQQYQITHNEIYGNQVLEFDVDSTEVSEIKLNVFSAPFVKELENTNINLQHIASRNGDDLKGFANKPRLILKNPNGYDTNFIIQDNNGAIFGAGYNSINNGTQYDGSSDNNAPLPQVTTDGNSLLFGFTNPIYTPTLANIPSNTLFNKYWADYINEKYNVTNGLIYKAEFNLKPTDIYNFKFSDIVKIQEQHYRVNKIEFNTDKNTLAKVELLRI